MKCKRLLASLLVAATVVGIPPAVAVPAGAALPAAAASSSFTDISDPKVAEAAELLRLLGVVDGSGSGFSPSGTLSRAQFCKMAVEIMGRGDQEPANRNRTIFKDVGPSYWARGYINLASSITLGNATPGKDGETAAPTERLIMGVGNGNFEPEAQMTVGAAVAILTRILGYSNADVSIGSVWYDGYLAIAKGAGLLDGLNVSGSADITRGQAAILFQNLLFAKSKGTDTQYLNTLNCKIDETTILLSTDATAADGTTGSVQTLTATYKTDSANLTPDLQGMRGKLLLDKDNNALMFLPNEGDTIRRVSVVGSPEANYIPVAGDEKIDVTLTTRFIKGTEDGAYEKVWTGLRSGSSLVLCYNSAGKLDYIYMPTAGSVSVEEANVMVAKNKPNGTANPFAALTGGASNVAMYKNGAPATAADIQQYDVATYDKAARALYVSDLRLTGLYENVYPNSSAPSSISMMGVQLPVLPSAVPDLASFKVGEQMTVLLTSSGQVAGAVKPSISKSTAVGIATVKSGTASIELLDGMITLKGSTTASDTLNGYLVNVTSSTAGVLNLNRISGSGSNASLNVSRRTLGDRALAVGVQIYEQVGNGPIAKIEYKDITSVTVPSGNIAYVSYDASGKVNRLVLDDVTGDRYYYGKIDYKSVGVSLDDHNGTISVENSRKDNPGALITGNTGNVDAARDGAMGGIAPSLTKSDSGYKLARYMELKSITGLTRAAFDTDEMLVSSTRATLPISDNVVCYNATTRQWISYDKEAKEALLLALAYTDNLTVYYDRSPENGGKVRIVVVE